MDKGSSENEMYAGGVTPTLHLYLFANGTTGDIPKLANGAKPLLAERTIDIPYKETNVFKIYQQCKAKAEAQASHHAHAVLYFADPYDANDYTGQPWYIQSWQIAKHYIAKLLGFTMSWALDDSYNQVLDAASDFAKVTTSNFNIEIHGVGAKVGATLLRQLANEINAKLKDDLSKKGIQNYQECTFKQMIYFDSSEQALDEFNVFTMVKANLMEYRLNKRALPLVPANTHEVMHFVALHESKDRVLLIDRGSVEVGVSVIESWHSGNSRDICTHNAEQRYTIDALNNTLGDFYLELPSSEDSPRNNTADITREIRIERDGEVIAGKPYVGIETLGQAVLSKLCDAGIQYHQFPRSTPPSPGSSNTSSNTNGSDDNLDPNDVYHVYTPLGEKLLSTHNIQVEQTLSSSLDGIPSNQGRRVNGSYFKVNGNK